MLRDLQQAFADAIIAGNGGAAAQIADGKLASARRIEIYRHNVFSNLRGVLSDVFPVVERIVGDAFFRHAADQFIRETPSRSGDLNAKPVWSQPERLLSVASHASPAEKAASTSAQRGAAQSR